MFQSIRNYFKAMGTAFLQPDAPRIFEYKYHDLFPLFEEDEGYFTQAEQQQLKGILSELIQILDENRKSHRMIAKAHPVGSFNRNFHFAGARHFDAKLAKVVKLQTKIKHTLQTRG